MSATVANTITRIRDQLFDTDSAAYRWSDAQLLKLMGAAQRKIAELRPEACVTHTSYGLSAGARQRLSQATAVGVREVHANYNGSAIRRVERDVLDTFYAAWPTLAAVSGNYKAYALDAQDPLAFLLFPAGVVGDTVTITYIALPTDPTSAPLEELQVPLAYTTAVVDYVTYTALLSEAHGADTNETKRYLDQFKVQLGLERNVQASAGQEAARPPEAKA